MEKSQIYLYDWETGEQYDAMKGDCYVNGSHGADWEGILIEKVTSTGTHAKNVYIKDCHLWLATEEVSYEKDGKTYYIEEDEVTITPRNKAFTVDNDGGYTGIYMSVSIGFLKEHFYDKDIDELEFTDFYRVDDRNLKYLILMIYQQAILKTSKDDGFLKKLFETLTVYYIHNYSNYFKESSGFFNERDMATIDKYILDNLSENITTMELAELLHISNYTFLNEFKNYTKTAPAKYILNVKFDLAKQLLRSNKHTITEIAHSLGFYDNSHFTKFFKRKEGRSPRDYQKDCNAVTE